MAGSGERVAALLRRINGNARVFFSIYCLMTGWTYVSYLNGDPSGNGFGVYKNAPIPASLDG